MIGDDEDRLHEGYSLLPLSMFCQRVRACFILYHNFREANSLPQVEGSKLLVDWFNLIRVKSPILRQSSMHK